MVLIIQGIVLSRNLCPYDGVLHYANMCGRNWIWRSQSWALYKTMVIYFKGEYCISNSISAQFVADRVDSFTVLLRKMVNNLRVRLVKSANSLITEITWSPYFLYHSCLSCYHQNGSKTLLLHSNFDSELLITSVYLYM